MRSEVSAAPVVGVPDPHRCVVAGVDRVPWQNRERCFSLKTMGRLNGGDLLRGLHMADYLGEICHGRLGHGEIGQPMDFPVFMQNLGDGLP
jgi:hypothetical protein